MPRQFQVTFDAADPARLGAFWAAALDYVEEPPPEGFDSWQAALEAWGVPPEERDSAYAVVDPDGSQRIFFQRVPEPKTAKNRVHLDVRVSDRSRPVAEQEESIQREARRLEQLGATRVDWVAEIGKHFMLMRDPEGNEFCLT